MANPYAVDFSGLATEIKGFKQRRYDKKLKAEVDSLLKKREGLDTELSNQVSKQRQLIADTPEMDQSFNQASLNRLQDQRLLAQTNKYNELGGLSSEDFKDLSTEAVDIYKARVGTEREARRTREDQMTADALITYEAMGKNPKYLKNWFNETQAHKWGMPDGVAKFEETGNSVLVYQNGIDYSKEGNIPTVIPKEQFNMFASSALSPESTKLMAKSLKEGNIPIIVKANQLKESMKYYDTLEEARTAMGIGDADWKKMMGVPTAVETLKEYINVVDPETGKVVGLSRGVSKEGEEFQRVGLPKQVTTGKGAGSDDWMKNMFKLADLTIKGGAKRTEARDKMLNSEFGREFFEFDKELQTFVPQIPKIRKTLNKKIAEADKTTEEGKEIILASQRILGMIKETDEQVFNSANGVVAITQLINTAMGDPLSLEEDVLAAPVGIEKPAAGGVSKSLGSTKRTMEGDIVPALEPHVTPPVTSGLPTSPPEVLRPDARAKRTAVREGLGMSPEDKAARIEELRKKAKELL